MNPTGGTNQDFNVRLRRDLAIQQGLAAAYANSVAVGAANPRDRLLVAATFHRRAGANALLLGEYRAARQQFLAAATLYMSMQMPYAVAMAALYSTQAQFLQTFLKAVGVGETRLAPEEVPQLAFAALAQAAVVRRVETDAAVLSDQLLTQLNRFRARPIGTVGIPVGVLLDLAAALQGVGFDGPAPTVRQSVGAIVTLYQNAELQARSNIYHYQRLALPYHPVEPDFFSILRLAEAALRQEDAQLELHLEEVVIDPTLRDGIRRILYELRMLDESQ